MSTRSQDWLRWSARILGCVVCFYLGLFALDATGVRDAVIHLSPAALVLAVLALGWRWPALGGAGFMAIAAAYTVAAWSHPTWIAAISMPLVAVGALFLASRPRRTGLAA